MEQKIIVSAIGYNSVHGTGSENYWNYLGRSGSSEVHFIGDVDPQKYLNSKGQKFMNRASLIYCNVAFQCIFERGLQDFIKANQDRVGLYDSSELSNLEACFQFDIIARNEGPDYVSPMNAPNTIANAAASQMAIQAGIKGPNFTVCSGASGSLQAVDIASLHLKQGITDFAIVGSTEVRNKYQMAIRLGERRNDLFDSSEQGAAVLLERITSGDAEALKRGMAVVSRFVSGTQFSGETKEDLVCRLVGQVLGNAPAACDLCIVSGGAHVLDELILKEKLLKQGVKAPVSYPEKLSGAGDNAGGILGIIYAVGIFRGKLKLIHTETGIQSLKDPVGNALVVSIDQVGGASVALLSNPQNNN